MARVEYNYNSPISILEKAQKTLERESERKGISLEEYRKIREEIYDIECMIKKRRKEKEQGYYICSASVSDIVDAYKEENTYA